MSLYKCSFFVLFCVLVAISFYHSECFTKIFGRYSVDHCVVCTAFISYFYYLLILFYTFFAKYCSSVERRQRERADEEGNKWGQKNWRNLETRNYSVLNLMFFITCLFVMFNLVNLPVKERQRELLSNILLFSQNAISFNFVLRIMARRFVQYAFAMCVCLDDIDEK